MASLVDVITKKPKVTLDEAKEFFSKYWNYPIDSIDLYEFNSYDYRTYRVCVTDTKNKVTKYVMKIANKQDSGNMEFMNCFSNILQHLEARKLYSQFLVKPFVVGGDSNFFVDYYENGDLNVQPLKAYSMTYVEGELVCNCPLTAKLCYEIARKLCVITGVIDEISDRLQYLKLKPLNYHWSMENVVQIRQLAPKLEHQWQRDLVNKAFDEFESKVLPNLDKMTKGFIHGDPNEQNILIDNNIINGNNKDQFRVVFIDWQDCAISYKAYDLAILIYSLIDTIYVQTGQGQIADLTTEEVGRHCLAGYQSCLGDVKFQLNEVDLELLPCLVQTRIAVSLTIGQYSYRYIDPTNVYTMNTARYGWEILQIFLDSKSQLMEKWVCKT